jgi:hypothetical protein
MSDGKIFAMSELHGGGVWCDEDEEPPHQELWQSQVKWLIYLRLLAASASAAAPRAVSTCLPV